jgi:uncharacterized RDD family membrane protein YckC
MESIVAKLWRVVVEASTSTLAKPPSHPAESVPIARSPDDAASAASATLAKPASHLAEASVIGRTSDAAAPITLYAGFWRRLGALLVDGLVFLPISVSVTWVSAQSRLAALLLLLPLAALGCAYEVYFHARWGQTLGKMANRVRVVSVDGSRIGFRQALLRSAVDILFSGLSIAAQASALLRIPAAEYGTLGWLEQRRRLTEAMGPWEWLSWLGVAWTLSEVVTMLFNRRRRALHDFIAGTIVVRITPPVAVSGLAEQPALP